MAQAPRSKLTLSKLDFLSLVDRPAQETASIRLIKRAGADDHVEVSATMRVVGIGKGDNPLVHCWAFTCTDETGAPYHDLQGDAITDDFIKAAEEFMRSGAAVDEMHDGKQTSHVAFAYPMDSDIARGMFGDAIGKGIKTSGLMAAIRPSPDALVKLRDGTYNGVSIAGNGIRVPVGKAAGVTVTNHLAGSAIVAALSSTAGQRAIVDAVGKAKPPRIKPKAKKKPPMPDGAAMPYKRLVKRAVLTSATDGHQHTLDLDAPADCWSDTLMTSYQTSEGATEEHCHAWVYDATTGAITIALDSGHDHTVTEVVPPDVIAEAAADGDDEAIPVEVADEPSSGKTSIVVVSARAPAGISTPSGPGRSVNGTSQENHTMEPKIAKMLTLALLLPETQRAHVAKLAPDDQVAFLGMDAASRTAAVTAAEMADPIVHTTKSGLAIRKSAGDLAALLAKQADAQADQITAQAAELAISKAATEQVTLEKRAAADLSHFAKAITVRAAIVKAIDGIADEAVRKEAHEAIKGANAAMLALGKAHGANDGGDPVAADPLTAWNTGLAEFAKSKSIANPLDATPAFLATEQGRALKKSYDATRAYAQHGQA